MTTNTMCIECAKLRNGCSGTTEQVWTGCIYREIDREKSTFNFYKTRLIREGGLRSAIRFIAIEYLCQFPGIDPYEMAASLERDGFTILFDDSSISMTENRSKAAKVARLRKN